MRGYLRLRQICLVSWRLEPLVSDLGAILGVDICHRDPGVLAYGLENAVLGLGTNFLELVAPVREDTAAGRFLSRVGNPAGTWPSLTAMILGAAGTTCARSAFASPTSSNTTTM